MNVTVHLLRLIWQIVKVFFWEIWAFLHRSVTSVTWLQARLRWKPNSGTLLVLSIKALCSSSLCSTSHHCYSSWFLWAAQSRGCKDHSSLPQGLNPKPGWWVTTGVDNAPLPLWDPPWNSRKSRKTAPGPEHEAVWHGDVPNPKGFLGSTWRRRLFWELWGAQNLAALSPGEKDNCLFPGMAVLGLCWTGVWEWHLLQRSIMCALECWLRTLLISHTCFRIYCSMASFTWAHEWLHKNEIKLSFWADAFPVVISKWSVRRYQDQERETELRQEKEGEKQQVVHSAYSPSLFWRGTAVNKLALK